MCKRRKSKNLKPKKCVVGGGSVRQMSEIRVNSKLL